VRAYGEVSDGAAGLIVAARIEAGLTQRELAVRAHTSPAAIANYETGKAEPRLSTLERVLAAAGMELRVGFAPMDPAQEALRVWEDGLSPEVIGGWRDAQARRIKTDLAAARHRK